MASIAHLYSLLSAYARNDSNELREEEALIREIHCK